MQQLLKLGAACNVLYLFSMDVDTLTGPSALKKAIGHLMDSRSVFRPVLAHFKVSSSGITLTDTARKVFFRRHYNTSAITFCGLDPADRRWKTRDTLSEDKVKGIENYFICFLHLFIHTDATELKKNPQIIMQYYCGFHPLTLER